MVVIRFQRLGTKKTPAHRVVVQEQRQAQSSRVLEVIGHYDPSAQPANFDLDKPRLDHWVSRGAQVSEALARIVRKHAKPAPAAKKSAKASAKA